MVSSRGQKKLGPRPDRSSFRGLIQNSDEHPHPFHMGSPPGRSYLLSLVFVSLNLVLSNVLFSCFDLLFLLVHEFMLKFANLLIAILGMLLAWHCQM